MEGQLAQGRTADGAGVIEHCGEVEPARAGRGDEAAVDRAGDVGTRSGAGNPLIAGVIEQFCGFHRKLPEVGQTAAARLTVVKSLKSPGALPFCRLRRSASTKGKGGPEYRHKASVTQDS
jgi:hypothetical protein